MIKQAIVAVMVAAGLCGAPGRVSAQTTLTDGQVLALFDEANTTDIWTARVAMARGQSTQVKELAAMVAADHEIVQQMARDLARTQKIVVAPPPGDGSATALATAIQALQEKSAVDFDRAYVAHELAFHRAAIDAVKGTLLPAARNSELRELLTKVLAGFEHHLAETRSVAGRMGVR